MHGELYTTKIVLDNRSYFFNVKENRAGDVFLQIVESKSRGGEDFERRDIVVFADDMQQFFRGLDESLAFIDRDRRERKRAGDAAAKIYRKPPVPRRDERRGPASQERAGEGRSEDAAPGGPAARPARTGRVHIVSKKTG